MIEFLMVLKTVGGAAAPSVLALMQQAMDAMSPARCKSVGATLLLLGALGTGAALSAKTEPRAITGKVEAARKDLYGDPLPPGAVARMGTIRLRGASERVAFSSDGKTVISTDWLSIRTWETATGKPLRRTPLEFSASQGIAKFDACVLSSDGKTLVAAAGDTLLIWDATTGRERRRISSERLLAHALAVSPDGRTLAVGTFTRRPGNPIRLWNTTTGEAKPAFRGHEEGIIALVFSPDSKKLASSSWDGTVRVWNATTGEQVHKLRLTDPFRFLPVMTNHLAFSPDGKLLAAGNYAKAVKLWDVQTGEERATLEAPWVNHVISVAFSPDGKTLAAGGDGSVVLFDAATRKQLRHWPESFSGLFRFSPDGKILASCRSGTIRLWDVATGKLTHSWPGHKNPILWTGALPDGRTLLSIARAENAVCIWDITDGKFLTALRAAAPYIWSATLSANGKYLAIGCSGGIV